MALVVLVPVFLGSPQDSMATVSDAALSETVLDAAYLEHPQRFVRKPPQASEPPSAVWINPPDDQNIASENSDKSELNCETELSNSIKDNTN